MITLSPALAMNFSSSEQLWCPHQSHLPAVGVLTNRIYDDEIKKVGVDKLTENYFILIQRE